MSLVSFDQLLEAGAHFGHMPRKWNPAMAPYIFMERNGIHIIDLHKTVAKIDECAEIIKNMASSGKKILFVGTKRQAKEPIAELAKSVGMPYVTAVSYTHLDVYKRQTKRCRRESHSAHRGGGIQSPV